MEPPIKDVPIEDTSLYNRDASSDHNSIEAVKALLISSIAWYG